MITTVIGAYPKPDYLKLTDWFNAKGGTDTADPTSKYIEEIKRLGDNAETIFNKATKEVVNDQIECGIDIITDGEIRRENYIHYHCRHLSGIDFNKLTEKTARTGNYKCWLPTIVNKVEATDSFLDKDFIKAQQVSEKPVKMTLPGPMTITDTISNQYYNSDKKLGRDLAVAINTEVKRLYYAGCKFIQIDEPLFARKPKEALEYGIENLERCFDGLENIKLEKITHICCGYPDKLDAINYPKAPLDSYLKISKRLDESIIDTVSLEDAHRYNDLNLFSNFKKTKIILGLIKIASSVEETEDIIIERLKKVSDYIDLKNIIAAPDCGLGHLPRLLAKKKLSIMVQSVKKI